MNDEAAEVGDTLRARAILREALGLKLVTLDKPVGCPSCGDLDCDGY